MRHQSVARRWIRAIRLLAALPLIPSRATGQQIPPSLAQFLQDNIELTPSEMQTATTGTPVVKVLETPDKLEITVFGIVRIDAPRAFYVARATDYRESLRRPGRLNFGLFSDPPVAADVANLSLRHSDVEELERCRPGSCKLKLSADAMARLRAQLDSAPAAADSVVNAVVRERVLQYVTAYRARGNQALVVYADQRAVTSAEDVFHRMLARSPYLYEYTPALERYLKNYPEDRPPGISETLFWSQDDIPGLSPTITINHALVYSPPELAGSTLIVSKLLYADHYLDGALELSAVVDQPDQQPSGIYRVSVRRFHFDNLSNAGPINVRAKATAKFRDDTRTMLTETKVRTERAYRPS